MITVIWFPGCTLPSSGEWKLNVISTSNVFCFDRVGQKEYVERSAFYIAS